MVTHWLGHIVVSAVVHAVAYGAAFAVFRHMTGTDAVGLAVLVIGVILAASFLIGIVRRLIFGRSRRW